MVVSCSCFEPRHYPYYNYLCRAPDITAVETVFLNVFSYDAVLSRVSNLPAPRRRADALRVELRSYYPSFQFNWGYNSTFFIILERIYYNLNFTPDYHIRKWKCSVLKRWPPYPLTSYCMNKLTIKWQM